MRARKKVTFGICAYNWEPFSYTPKIYEEIALGAESLGFDSFFITDHFMRPHTPGFVPPREHATIEAWSLLSNLAAKTNTIKLGTCVTPIPLRRPAILAKVVATVDILSDGRAILGAGAGWDRPEFEGYGEWRSNSERVEMTREGIDLIRRLWSEDSVTYEGKYFKTNNAVLEPKPVQKNGPEIWVGAIHDKMLKLTAEMGDAWFPGRAVGATLEHYSKSVPKIKKQAEVCGRKTPLKYALMGYFTEPNVSLSLPALGTMDKASEVVEAYAEAGCEYIAAMFFPVAKFKELMKNFAKDVVPSFS